MSGKSFMIKGKDSMIFERVQIIKQGDDILYIPVVTDQNKNQPVTFKLISSDNDVFTFENKQHDFPQRVIYQFIGKDSIAARIEGQKNGVPMSQPFNYSRVK